MTRHGTALQVTGSIVREFHASVIAQLPDLCNEEMQWCIRNKGKLGGQLQAAFYWLKQLQDQYAEKSDFIRNIPVEGMEFELTLDIINPMQMVRDNGYNAEGWKFTGKAVGPMTRTFRLVRVGSCVDLNEVRTRLAEYGPIPEGQWKNAFLKAFPNNDGKGAIGFADPSWITHGGRACFNVLLPANGDWVSFFKFVDEAFDESWRWLVAVK